MALKRRGRRKSATPSTRMFSLLVCYDIAGDDRRDDVSRLLTTFGPRVQQSVFECRVRASAELAQMRKALEGIIDVHEDQVRIYNFGCRESAPTIVGNRELEEWRDFRIL